MQLRSHRSRICVSLCMRPSPLSLPLQSLLESRPASTARGSSVATLRAPLGFSPPPLPLRGWYAACSGTPGLLLVRSDSLRLAKTPSLAGFCISPPGAAPRKAVMRGRQIIPRAVLKTLSRRLDSSCWPPRTDHGEQAVSLTHIPPPCPLFCRNNPRYATGAVLPNASSGVCLSVR